jgi:hypothetical protein
MLACFRHGTEHIGQLVVTRSRKHEQTGMDHVPKPEEVVLHLADGVVCG